MDTTELELELLDLEALYERTRNKITKAELADKIKLKRQEIKNANKVELEKNIIPSRDVPSRMDHDEKRKQAFSTGNGSFKAFL